MIAKKYRLSEGEVKKVLKKGKPFFSYSLVFRSFPNTLGHARFAIVIGGKSVSTAVLRNIYRRAFYNLSAGYIESYSQDIVCVIPAKTKLGSDKNSQKNISSQWSYILTKKLGKNT